MVMKYLAFPKKIPEKCFVTFAREGGGPLPPSKYGAAYGNKRFFYCYISRMRVNKKQMEK
jgi:hypothetical protein